MNRLDEAVLLQILARVPFASKGRVKGCCRLFRELLDSEAYAVARGEAGYEELAYFFVPSEEQRNDRPRPTYLLKDARWELWEPLPFNGYANLGTDGKFVVARDNRGYPLAACKARPLESWRLLPTWPSPDDDPYVDDGFSVCKGHLFVFAARGFAVLSLERFFRQQSPPLKDNDHHLDDDDPAAATWEWRLFDEPCPIEFDDEVKCVVRDDSVYLTDGHDDDMDLVKYDLGFFKEKKKGREQQRTMWEPLELRVNAASGLLDRDFHAVMVEVLLVFQNRFYALYTVDNSDGATYVVATLDFIEGTWHSNVIDQFARMPDSPAHFLADHANLFLVCCAVDLRRDAKGNTLPVAYRSDGGSYDLPPPLAPTWTCEWNPVSPPLKPPDGINNFFGSLIRCPFPAPTPIPSD